MTQRSYPRLPEMSSHARTNVHLDKVGVNGIRELVRVNFTRSESKIAPHMHPDAIELCYLAKGRQIYCVDDRDFKLRSGMAFVSHPNEWHHSKDYRQEQGVQLYYMIIDVVNDTECFLGMSGREASELAEEMKNLPYIFNVDTEIRNLFEELFSLHAERPPYWQTQLKCTAFQLCLRLVICARNEMDDRKVSVEMLRALNYIEDQLAEHKEIVLEDMADQAYLSLSQFNTRFRNEIGMAPKKYINRRRMEFACDMLSDGKKVTEVSYKLGFSSTQHFSSAFRSYYGIAPSEWKRQAAKDSEEKTD